ncbi:MAG: hypothetical protein Q7R33_09660 [Nitrosarchaeum sp.]|nr:hypothetical protein [Nitrosarchaeum sp.]
MSVPVITGQNPLLMDRNSSITLAVTDLAITGASVAWTLEATDGANYSVDAISGVDDAVTIIGDTDFRGQIMVPVRVQNAALEWSNTFNVFIGVVAQVETGAGAVMGDKEYINTRGKGNMNNLITRDNIISAYPSSTRSGDPFYSTDDPKAAFPSDRF